MSKKIKTIILSMLLTFSMSGCSLAAEVIPGYTGLDLDVANSNGINWTNPDANTVEFTLNAGIDTGYLKWNIFNLDSLHKVIYSSSGTYINNVIGNTDIYGEIKGINANIIFNSLGGAIIGDTAKINVNSLLVSSLDLKETDIAALRVRIENDKILELYEKGGRQGILVYDGADLNVTNRLDLVAAKIVSNKLVSGAHVDLVSTNPKFVYTTTDGIVFKLDDSGAVSSIYSSTGIAAGYKIPIEGIRDYTKFTPPIDPPVDPDPTSPDPMLPLSKILELKELTPTPQDLDLTDKPLNLAGTQMRVAPIDESRLVNNINPEEFSKDSVGAIAVNNSTDHMLAVSEFTPIGAASQVGNNGNQEEQQYDFVIPTPILE